MDPTTFAGELARWLGTLDPGFAFLLATPVIVAVAAFGAEAWRRARASRAATPRAARPPEAPRGPSRRDRHRPA